MDAPQSPFATLSLGEQSPEGDVLRLLIELGAQVVGADEGSLLVVHPRGDALVFAMTVGDSSAEAALRGQSVPLGEGITGLAALTREVQVGAPSFEGITQPQGRQGRRPVAVIAAPMLVADKLVGVLTAVSFSPGRRFGAAEERLYGRLGAVAGVVVAQKQRLDALCNAPTQTVNKAHLHAGERVFAAVARLALARPDRLGSLADRLEQLETLASQGSDK